MKKPVRLEGGPGDGVTVEANPDLEWLQWEGPTHPMQRRKSILSHPMPPPGYYRYRRDPARPNVYIYVGHSRHPTR